MKCGIGLYYCRSDLLTCIKLVKKTLELAGVMPFLSLSLSSNTFFKGSAEKCFGQFDFTSISLMGKPI